MGISILINSEYILVRELMLLGSQKSMFLSSPFGKFQAASEYGTVVMMGTPIITSLMQLLKDQEGDTHVIFMMLGTLSPEQPVISDDDRGKVKVIKQLWLEIGYKHNWIQR